MKELFIYDERLGISIPDLNLEWDEYTKGEQQQILVNWENIREASRTASRNWNPPLTESSFGSPTSDFAKSCQLNSEIAELASIINDLWLWYRANQGVTEKMHN